MKKFWNILVLTIFVNFTVLPSIVILGGGKLPQTNIIVSEEEPHTSTPFIVYEKTTPTILNINGFSIFKKIIIVKSRYDSSDYSAHLSPLIAVFSPPPEI